MLTYSFQVYKWPPSLLHEVARNMRNFIWSGNIDQRKLSTVAWSTICKPKEEGGLSVRDPSKTNQASLLFLTWKLLNSKEQWAHICRNRFLKNGQPKSYYIASSIWPGMKSYVQVALDHSSWSVGNGKTIHFWNDKWLDRSIVTHWNVPQSVSSSLNMLVSDCIHEGRWRIPAFIAHKDPTLASQICKIILPSADIEDKLCWVASMDGELNSKIAYKTMIGSGPQIHWDKLLWNSYIPPSRSFITWRLLHNRLPTDDNLRKRGCFIVSICCFCLKSEESSQHLFFTCPVTTQLWDWLGKGTGQALDCSSCLNLLMGRVGTGSKLVQQILNSAIVHTLWVIWIERNQRYFCSKKQAMSTLFNNILAEVRVSYSLSLATGNSSMQDYKVAKLFSIPFKVKRVNPSQEIIWNISLILLIC